jgi:hypothetical protein
MQLVIKCGGGGVRVCSSIQVECLVMATGQNDYAALVAIKLVRCAGALCMSEYIEFFIFHIPYYISISIAIVST